VHERVFVALLWGTILIVAHDDHTELGEINMLLKKEENGGKQIA